MDAVIRGLPLVGEDAVKLAAFRDGKTSYNSLQAMQAMKSLRQLESFSVLGN